MPFDEPVASVSETVVRCGEYEIENRLSSVEVPSCRPSDEMVLLYLRLLEPSMQTCCFDL